LLLNALILQHDTVISTNVLDTAVCIVNQYFKIEFSTWYWSHT